MAYSHSLLPIKNCYIEFKDYIQFNSLYIINILFNMPNRIYQMLLFKHFFIYMINNVLLSIRGYKNLQKLSLTINSSYTI